MVIVTRSEMRKIHSIERKIGQEFLEMKIPTGIQICEIQLYHLVNKIKDTKINEEIDKYIPAINDVLEGIDRDELIKKIVSVEFTRFFTYYNKTRDLNSDDRSNKKERGRSSDDKESIPKEGSVRYFINVGERDDYDWMSLKDFLRDTLNLDKDDIYKVDTKDTFSFFNTDAKFTPLILETFSDFKVDGRFVNVEVSKNPSGGGGRGRSRSSGGRRDRNRSNSGGGRRDRNSSYAGRKGRKGNGNKSKNNKNKGFY